jgi:hypothetical protein
MKPAQLKLFETMRLLTMWVFFCLMLFGTVRTTFAADIKQPSQNPVAQQSQSKPPVISARIQPLSRDGLAVAAGANQGTSSSQTASGGKVPLPPPESSQGGTAGAKKHKQPK